MAKVNKNIENVYPLSPLQEGMLFHYLSDRNTTAYILQSLYNIKENFDTSSPAGRLQMTMLAAISQFEREMILERQREGIAIAKAAGRYKGRKAVSVPNIGTYYQKYMSRQSTKSAIAQELGISRTTLDKLFLKHQENINMKEVLSDGKL